jgi:hypothetical protein
MAPRISDEALLEAAESFGNQKFSTKDLIDVVRHMHPADWALVEQHYGTGGAGAGKHFSAYSRVAQSLQRLFRHQRLFKHDYEAAPAGYGSPVIRFWSNDRDAVEYVLPGEETDEGEYWEGALKRVLVNRYERDAFARQKCLDHYGYTCSACDVDMGERYGERGERFIHVHHLVPLSKIKQNYKVNPITDLRPVCPNCHAMIHRSSEMLSINELRGIISKA